MEPIKLHFMFDAVKYMCLYKELNTFVLYLYSMSFNVLVDPGHINP